ncbi:MAG: 3-hydroxyacyl-CoA dehydrogenase family protein [Rhodobacter sp.]|nr:3-hydroxyacyl-CoA dehydrogenase family protein [Rhodobacter sp.]
MLASLPDCSVLGPGTMGGQIALSLAMGGAHVTLWGRRAEALGPALDRCAEGFDFLAAHGLAKSEDRAAVLDRITPQPDLAKSVMDAGFVIEAITEDLALKRALLDEAERAAPETAILSSTTSAISAGDLQSGLRRPRNFCIAHYAQPAHLVELVEVVPGHGTADTAVAATTALLEATGKTPVTCPDIPGFLWARIQHTVLREFASLVGRGLVTPDACDTILKVGYASRLPAMGAFEHADLAGLDLINSNASKAVWADLSNVTDPAETPVGELFGSGHLGMKSGRGFYDWKPRDAEAFRRQRDEEIIRRIKLNRNARTKRTPEWESA